MKNILQYFGIFIFSAEVLLAQEPAEHKLRLSYSFLDIPQNFNSDGNYPSMIQSVELSSSLYDLSFWGIDALGDAVIKNKNNTTGGRITKTVFKYLAGFGYSYYASKLPVPLGVYTHEEFHRSVLGTNDLSALNGNWIFNRWDGTVYGLNDEDLTLLKQNNISALLYSYVSGVQSENYMTQVNAIQDFYHPRTFYKNPYYLYNAFYVWDYFNFSAGEHSDSVKVLAPPHEDTNPFYRDYAGADLTAWIYDMFSPEQPFTNRDPFPDGEGVNRRIGFGDLTKEGQDYLKKQKNLSLLNFANPAIFLINRIKVSPNFSFLFFMQYSPTHFGNDIVLFIPFQRRSLNHLLAVHNYNNMEKNFVGIQYGIFNIMPFHNKNIEVGGMISLWNQPVNQGFFDHSGKLGGAIELTADYHFCKNFSASLTTGYKTKGWMIGNPYIDQKVRVNAGIKYYLKHT